MKAIIFDCFGVLAENGWGLIDDKLQPTKQQWDQMSAVSHACDKGIISMEELVQRFAETLDVQPQEVTEIIDSQRKNLQLLDVIRTQLKPMYKIAMLSNVGSGFVQDYFTDEELQLFDVLTLSSDIGFAKPDPRIYKHCANDLGVQAADCLFIDDSPVNIQAAKELGMQAHLYTSLKGLRGLCE